MQGVRNKLAAILHKQKATRFQVAFNYVSNTIYITSPVIVSTFGSATLTSLTVTFFVKLPGSLAS